MALIPGATGLARRGAGERPGARGLGEEPAARGTVDDHAGDVDNGQRGEQRDAGPGEGPAGQRAERSRRDCRRRASRSSPAGRTLLSTRTPWAFVATSRTPPEAPMANSAAISSGRLRAKPGVTVATQLPTPQIRTSSALPARSTSRSARAAPITSPTGTAKSAMPSVPSDRCACDLAAGMRAIHTPPVSPMTRKCADTANRAEPTNFAPRRHNGEPRRPAAANAEAACRRRTSPPGTMPRTAPSPEHGLAARRSRRTRRRALPFTAMPAGCRNQRLSDRCARRGYGATIHMLPAGCGGRQNSAARDCRRGRRVRGGEATHPFGVIDLLVVLRRATVGSQGGPCGFAVALAAAAVRMCLVGQPGAASAGSLMCLVSQSRTRRDRSGVSVGGAPGRASGLIRGRGRRGAGRR